jgi:hypothetical protein
MRTYFAGNTAMIRREKIVLAAGATNRLISYYHALPGGSQHLTLEWLIDLLKGNNMPEQKVRLFLDSGAFSAWTMNVPISIQDYIKFIKRHELLFEVYANLDVIGLGGKRPNKLTAKKTLENQKIMEEAGLTPLPCFHFGEPFEYLQYYIDNYDYLALGVAGNSGTKLIPWLNTCFSNYICDSKGMPKIKAHGFAVTSLKIMLAYPWFSVDSTSWIMTGRMGKICMPIRTADGKWLYDEHSWKIGVSNRSPSMKDKGAHYTTLSQGKLKIFMSYLEEKGYELGESKFHIESPNYTLKDNERWASKKKKGQETREVETIIHPGISNDYKKRDELNILYYLDFEKSMPEWPWPFKGGKKHGFF